MLWAAAMTTPTAEQQLQKLLNGPAMAPPPGVKPNLENPPHLEKEFYIDLILCLTISMLVVGMRLWTKARLVRRIMIEDCKSCLRVFFFSFPSSFPFLAVSPLPSLTLPSRGMYAVK